MRLAIGYKLLKKLSETSFINKFVYRLSSRYIEIFNGYSYEFRKNGEEQLLKALGDVFEKKSCFFDVGANIGEWTRYAIKYFKEYEGYLFEISARTFKNLETGYSKDEFVYLNNVALSDENKETVYRDYGENYGGNTLLLEASYHKKTSELINVMSLRGDVFCRDNNITRINFLKIDTEGTELSVLRGFEKLFQKKEIDIVQFEYGYTHGDANTLMKDFFKFFESYGYLLGPLREKGVQFKDFSYTDNDFKSGPNWVACLPWLKERISKF
jgi:FkbM family methyltransferase